MNCEHCQSTNLICLNCGLEQTNRKTRSLRQNSSLHLWLGLLAQELNNAGIEYSQVIKVDIPWTGALLKEILIRPTMAKFTGKTSTTKLTTKELTDIYDIINRAISERCGVSVPWPSLESEGL